MATRAPQQTRPSVGHPPGAAPAVGAATSLAASFTLLALTVGVPVALYAFGHQLLPTTVVKPGQIWTALKSPDDGHLFLQGLYLAAWVGWFFFFLSVFLEIVAVVQHRAALRLPGLAWMQRGVGTLVTAAVVIIASPVAAMAATPPSSAHAGGGTVASASAIVRGDQFAGRQGPAAAQLQNQGQNQAAAQTYVVQSGDSLWKIAQEQLGDPNRFADIARLNDGRQMPDGSVFHYSEFLRSGWVLVMPPDTGVHPGTGTAQADSAAHAGPAGPAVPAAADAANAANAATVAPVVYTVRNGDTLTSIAKAQLGDTNRWSEIFELNKGKPQPGGPPIWRPDLIWPGDNLIMPVSVVTPATQTPATQTPEAQTPAAQTPAAQMGTPPPLHQRPPIDATAEPTNPAVAPPVPSTPATSTPSTGQAQPTERATHPQTVTTLTQAGSIQSESGKTIGSIGGLLAAGLLTVLGTKRLARLRQRRPGELVGMPAPDDWELEMRTVENPTGRVFIDAALRTLAANLAEADRILPDLTATVLKSHGLELHLARMEPPVAPFYADASRPGVWVCPLGAPLAAADASRSSQAPYPALVSLGFDEGDDSVLVDLEATRGVSLMVPAAESVAMLRALAVEMGTGVWAEQLAITLVGFGSELPEIFETGSFTRVDDLTAAVDDLARWSATVEAVLDRRDVSLREARTYPDPELAIVAKTHILLSAVPLDAQSAYRLRQLLSGRQRTSIAVVALGQDPECLLSPWAVTGPSFQTPPTQAGGPAVHIRMQALRDEQYSAIIRDLSGAGIDDEWASAQRDGFGSGTGTGHHRPRPVITPPIQPRPVDTASGARAPLPRRLADTRTGSGHLVGLGTSPSRIPARVPGAAPILPTPELTTPNRFRIPVDDLFRATTLPPTADTDTVLLNILNIVPAPGTADKARHALNPANLPQFDLVLTPWHGQDDTEQILAVPNAAPMPKPKVIGLTTFAGPGSLDVGSGHGQRSGQESVRDSGQKSVRDSGQGQASKQAAGHLRAGTWQSTYWDQRKAAGAGQQNIDVDPAAMSRSIDFLGPVDLSGTSGTAGSRAADLAEVAAFVILHPGCSANQIAAELWPGRSGAVAIRDAQVARLREFLGTDADGVDHLQVTADGYRMGPSVTSDWLDFMTRVQAGELVAAISLVRGRPFQDAPLRRYGWAESLRHEMTALVIDTAHYVAEACLREHNPRGAQNAAYRGLQAAPESELLYRDLLTALANLGDMAGARQHADTLIAYADREGIDLQPETTALIRDVLQAVPGV